jgi:cell division protein FtsW (lipid II flippase)
MLFTVLLLMIFAISIAYATFIENDYGTDTAQALIYQAWWFELLLIAGVINLTGSVFKYHLVNRKKWAILLFHLAFILIILCAGVTRYFVFEGACTSVKANLQTRLCQNRPILVPLPT